MQPSLRSRAYRRALVACLFAIPAVTLGCSVPKGGNANSGTNANRNANTESVVRSSASATVDVKEPERYSVAVTITAQEAADDPAKMQTLQFNLTRLDADRRWAFALPAPLGQVVYLEKSGLRYLVLQVNKQYVEVGPDEFGFPLVPLLTPTAIADQLNGRAQFENLGVEPVNGRTATKHRFVGTAGDRPPTDGVVYVDTETRLPVRSEVNMTLAGTKLRMMVESRDIQLNPDRAQFDVPAGMKRVTSPEAKQQIESFASSLRVFVDIIRGSKPTTALHTSQAAANKNATRRGR